MTDVLLKNKGEWAELYVLYSLLGKGFLVISAPGETTGPKMIIQSVSREDKPGIITVFSVEGDNILISENGQQQLKISQYDFLLNAEKVKQDLKKGSGSSFSLSDKSNAFMQRLGIVSPKAKSLKTEQSGLPFGGKNDILIAYQDPSSGISRTVGFSIKSSFAHPATLQNGTKLTNFVFSVDGLNANQIKDINVLCQKRARKTGEPTADVLARCDQIRNYGAIVASVGIGSSSVKKGTFERNLMMIDLALPDILSEIIYLHYFDNAHPCFLSEMPRLLAIRRPLQDPVFDIAFYERKIKDFLFACFSGMIPGTPWTGKTDQEGGYIIIDKDFGISGCLSTETEAFKNYLIKNTKLEHSDCSTARSDYGKIFLGQDNRYYINLNLQVRFCRPNEN